LRVSRESGKARRCGHITFSPHLHFGEISPGQVWRLIWRHERQRRGPVRHTSGRLADAEFAYYLLHSSSGKSPKELFGREFAAFPWRWIRNGFHRVDNDGRTGYPLGLRHAASCAHGWAQSGEDGGRIFLASTADRLAGWCGLFWDTLVDAGSGQHTLAGSGSRVVARIGAYFLIFNPSVQAEKSILRRVPSFGSGIAAVACANPIVDNKQARDVRPRRWRVSGRDEPLILVTGATVTSEAVAERPCWRAAIGFVLARRRSCFEYPRWLGAELVAATSLTAVLCVRPC